jgi:hypothetical protein
MQIAKSDIAEDLPSLRHRLLWFGAIWALSVLALGIVATLIKFVLD